MAGIAALATAYILSQFYRSFLAVLTPVLTTELGATKAELSTASGIWFAVFASMQFAVGVSLDRFGPRKTASIMLAIGGAGGAFLFAAASEPWMVIAAMALIGFGCSPVLMASIYIFANAYPPARLSILASTILGVGMLGNVIGASPLAAAAEAFGWRTVLTGLAVVTLGVAAAIYTLVRDPHIAEERRATSGFSGYLDLMKLKALWPILPLVAVNYAAAASIRGLWAGPYLADVYGATALAIGNATLFMALSMSAGSFIYGPLDNVFGSRKWVAVAGTSISLSALVFMSFVPQNSFVTTTWLLVVLGLCGSAYGLLMAHGKAFIPAHLTGRGVTLLNFFSIGGVGATQFATGAVVTAASVPGEPVAGYRALFIFYSVVLSVALFVYLFSKDAKPQRGEDDASLNVSSRIPKAR